MEGATNQDRQTMELALTRMRALERMAPENPYHAFWIGRMAITLRTSDSYFLWELAKERMTELGYEGEAHIHLTEGIRARAEGSALKARGALHEALDRWKVYPYAKGVCDAALRLGEIYSDLSWSIESRFDAVIYYRLSERIANRLELPKLKRARQGLFKATSRLPYSHEWIIQYADEQLEARSYALFLKGWNYSLSQA